MTGRVVRTTVSLEPEILATLDQWIRSRNAHSRSEGIRFMVRKELADRALENPDEDAVGAVMVLYDHSAPNVQRRLTAAQHRWGEHIRSSSHIHLGGDVCVEVMMLVGKRGEIVRAAEDLRGVKGIHQGNYVLASPSVAGGFTGHHHPHDGHGPAEARPRTPRPSPRRRTRS